MPKFTVDLTVQETRAVVRRYGWTDTVDDGNGGTIQNPVSAREYLRAWLPKFLADEIFEADLKEAADDAKRLVVKKTLPPVTDV